MGLRRAMRLLEAAETGLPGAPTTKAVIRSPWAVGQLSTIVWADIFGTESIPVTRAEAMSLPAMARSRHKIVAAIAKLPLTAYRRDTALAIQPPWLHRTDGRTSPQARVAWTVDDLIFSGWALWGVERGADKQITDAARCPPERWEFDPVGRVLVDGELVDDDTVILIPGFHEGVLTFGARTVRAGRQLEETWSQRAANPIPAVELHQNTPDQLTDDEIRAMVDDYQAALNAGGGTVVYSPASVDMRIHGTATSDLLIEGRNASAIDVARDVGIPAAMIDASNVNSTLTYETLQGRNLEFADDLDLYLVPIQARLSMDDVTPRGTRIAFDTTNLTAPKPSASGPALED